MDENELASLFAAKKEIEELKAQIERSESNTKSLVTEMNRMESHRRALDDQLLDKEIEIRKLSFFISELGRYPKFWALSYKKDILRFIEENGLWDGNND